MRFGTKLLVVVDGRVGEQGGPKKTNLLTVVDGFSTREGGKKKENCSWLLTWG